MNREEFEKMTEDQKYYYINDLEIQCTDWSYDIIELKNEIKKLKGKKKPKEPKMLDMHGNKIKIGDHLYGKCNDHWVVVRLYDQIIGRCACMKCAWWIEHKQFRYFSLDPKKLYG